MTDLDKNVENQIKEIVEKYQKEGNKLLNYLITDDKITFFSTINNGKQITAEDLQKVAEVLNGTNETEPAIAVTAAMIQLMTLFLRI